jgi:hypothetical protein
MQPNLLPPLIAAAQGFWEGIDSGGTRAAMIRFWRRRQLLRLPVPLTGAAAPRPGQSWEADDWLPAFLGAVEREAADGLDLLYALERAWLEARRAIAGRRKDLHDAAAVDVLAAAPVLSATTLARIFGIAVKNAIRILDAGIGMRRCVPRGCGGDPGCCHALRSRNDLWMATRGAEPPGDHDRASTRLPAVDERRAVR